MKVFVLNKHGEPLMPCNPRKARVLLRDGKAKVASREPFTIQLLFGSTGYKQPITIGVDTGHNEIGISVITKKEELFSATFQTRYDVSKKMTARKMYRRHKRNRLRYRKPRFNNRAASTRKGRLAPSVKCKVEEHIKTINLYASRLPKCKIVIETGNFDMAKMKNPNITNEMYQKGEQYGYENVKAYVRARDGHKCQSKRSGCSKILEVHHIKYRRDDGPDTPSNLITLCSKHHKQLHQGLFTLNVKKHKSLKEATIMNIVRKRLLEHYPEAIETFGYVTKVNRLGLELKKSHINDAYVIAGGKEQTRAEACVFKFKQANNRAIGMNRKGFAPTARKVRYKIQSGDIVEYMGKKYISKGNLSKGSRIYLEIDGEKKIVSSKNVKLVFNRGNLQRVAR